MSGSVEALEWQGFKAGGRRDFFITYAAQIGKFIEANKIKPVSSSQIHSPVVNVKEIKTANIAASPSYLIPWWYRGGKMFAHLHYAGEAYLLDTKQWQAFSAAITEDMSKKISAARSISFNRLLDISDTISGVNSVI